jgi:hypothetical protein
MVSLLPNLQELRNVVKRPLFRPAHLLLHPVNRVYL